MRFHPRIHVEYLEGDRVAITVPERRLTQRLSSVRELVTALQATGVSLRGKRPLSADEIYSLGAYARAGFLRYTALAGGEPGLTLEPMTPYFAMTYQALAPDTPVRGSRFGTFRLLRGTGLLETPLSHARILIEQPVLSGLWGLLAQAQTAESVAKSMGMDTRETCACLELLACAGLAGPADARGRHPEEQDEILRQWSHHEALFHARSRLGRHDMPSGATFAFLGEIPHQPARKPSPAGEPIPLARPSIEELVSRDMPLAQAMETRRSIRAYDDEHPITLEQLGQFLYRTVRAMPAPPGLNAAYETVRRPYPNGGGMGEMETYVVIDRCRGLERGLYHYDSWEHTLLPIEGPADQRERLLVTAQHASGMAGPPQVLLILAARAPRMLWKYSAMAYACMLKHTGVVIQTWYLVATAMGLAPCANGNGNSEAFARAAGLNPFDEISMGEFMLGSLSTRPQK
jgi:SagB-type dehydrogenase family enzyme